MQQRRERRLAELAAGQDGLLTRPQLLEAGLSESAIGRRLAAGRLHLLAPGVYALGHTALPARGRERAALLACGPDAVLSHRSAAKRWELHGYDGARLELTTVRAGMRAPAGVLLHRTTRLSPEEVTELDGIALTSPCRTLADLAAVVSRRSLERAMERADALALLDVPSVLRSSAHRPGAAAVRRVLATWSPDRTRSELEERLLELVRATGLPEPEVNARLHGFEVDLLWRDGRLVVEADGHAFHATRAAIERDRRRDAVLARRGHRVLRFTWMQVTRRPAEVRRAISTALG